MNGIFRKLRKCRLTKRERRILQWNKQYHYKTITKILNILMAQYLFNSDNITPRVIGVESWGDLTSFRLNVVFGHKYPKVAWSPFYEKLLRSCIADHLSIEVYNYYPGVAYLTIEDNAHPIHNVPTYDITLKRKHKND